jgi:Zn-dependent M28 family amino/carboxypeptidase
LREGPGFLGGFARWIDALPPGVVFALALGTTAVVGIVDEVTGRDLDLTFAYLLPIWFAAWFLGAAGGIAIAIAGAIAGWAADVATRLYAPPVAVQVLNFGSRAVLFAAVAGEEQGLLGSAYLGAHPPVPIGLLAANINIDELGIWGKTRDMIMIGKGKSTLDTVVEAIAAAQGRRHIVGDQNPDKGYFYRSDQFNLAKRGVPAAYLESGVEVVGKPPGWGAAQHAKYEETDYHQPSDELRPDWDFSGAVEDTQLLFYLGVKVAEGKNMPSWNPGDEFEGARKQALAESR